MNKRRWLIYFFLCLVLIVPVLPGQSQKIPHKEKRVLEKISDILAWKSIRSAVISNNGQWFAYRLAPYEGDSEVVIRQTKGEKEFRFPAGEVPMYGSAGKVAFSEDSNWIAFTMLPTVNDAKALKKQKKKLYNKAGLVNLLSGEKIEFDKVKSFAFSSENPLWIAFHKYPPESQEKEKEKWNGSDLILHELSSGNELNIGNVSEFAFNKNGSWLAWIIDAQEKSGNGVHIRNMATGVISPLDNGKAVYKKLTWTENGDGLTVLKGKESELYEEKLFSVLGFTQFSLKGPKKITYDPHEDKQFLEGMTISPNSTPMWTDDLSGIFFGIHEVKKKEKTDEKQEESSTNRAKDENAKDKANEDELPDLVIWHWLDKRLQPMQQVQEKKDKNFSYLCIYHIKDKKFIRLADEELRQVVPVPKQRWAIGFDNREYEWMGNLDGRHYQDIYIVDLKTGKRTLAIKKCRWYFSPSPDGTHFLFYNDGHYYTYNMTTGKSSNITKDIPTCFVNEENDHNIHKPPVRPVGWSKDGTSVLLYDNWDVWNVQINSGKGINLTVNGKKEKIRYQRRFVIDPEEKGIDVTGPVYFAAYGEWTKKGGVAIVDKDRPGAKMLLWDDAVFSRLLKAKNADVYLYTKETQNIFPDYYVSNHTLQKGQRITDANPQQDEFLWSSGGMLINYTSTKGDKLQAALFLPANYEKGKQYPTIIYIYEKLSQGLNRYYMPSANGFNKSVYTSRGYAVLMPDIVYKVNDPGMSAVWCILPAIEAAVEAGVVDKNRVALHGHSWGGYQTAFLITQTDLFKAAVAGAPLTNMISMYSSVYWNTGSTNQPIFESSQGRFKGGYWDNLEAYTRNSPVYFAKKIKTPILLLHNDKDGAVDWNQGIEYFNTIRRLNKPVVMLQYKGENHGLRKPANRKDYTDRMMEFFDHYLMGKPAPIWLKEGIPHIKLKDFLKDRISKIKQ